MKISGTSLIPAARPTPAPFHLRSSRWHRSQTIRAISTSSIWPRCSARCTGSIHSATAVRASRAAARARPRQPSAPSVNHTVPASAARLASGHQPPQHRPGQQRAGGEHHRGERRVGELDPGLQLPRVQLPRQAAGDQAGVVVDVEVVPVQHRARVPGHLGQVCGQRERAGHGRRRRTSRATGMPVLRRWPGRARARQVPSGYSSRCPLPPRPASTYRPLGQPRVKRESGSCPRMVSRRSSRPPPGLVRRILRRGRRHGGMTIRHPGRDPRRGGGGP